MSAKLRKGDEGSKEKKYRRKSQGRSIVGRVQSGPGSLRR